MGDSERGGGRAAPAAELGAAEPSGRAAELRDGPGRPSMLLVGTPREVLARICQGDPLGVRAGVAAHLRERAVLCDADRVHLRALVHVARGARRSSDGLAGLVADAVARAVDELVAEGSGPPPAGAPPDAHEHLAPPLGWSPAAARRAAAAFNGGDREDRAACAALLVGGRSLDELARALRVSASEVARRARRALELALAVLEAEGVSAARPRGGAR